MFLNQQRQCYDKDKIFDHEIRMKATYILVKLISISTGQKTHETLR